MQINSYSYLFDLKHSPGKKNENVVADARRPIPCPLALRIPMLLFLRKPMGLNRIPCRMSSVGCQSLPLMAKKTCVMQAVLRALVSPTMTLLRQQTLLERRAIHLAQHVPQVSSGGRDALPICTARGATEPRARTTAIVCKLLSFVSANEIE